MTGKDQRSVAEFIFTAIVVCLIVGFISFLLISNSVGSHRSPATECINNLRQIEAAKEEWALENGKTNGAFVTTSDITPYIQLNPSSQIPPCPSGGKYTIGLIGELPKCSIGTNDSHPHVLTLEREGITNGSH